MPAGGVPQQRVEVRAELSFPLQEALRDHGLEALNIHVTPAVYERLQLILPLLGHFLRKPYSLKDGLLLVAQRKWSIRLFTTEPNSRLLHRRHDVSPLEW